jgi:hypothetical protein
MSKKYTLQDYIKWNQYPGINPKTGKEIKFNGPTYNLIRNGWLKLLQDTNYNIDECNQWNKNKLINPRTKRIIIQNGDTYEGLRTKCELYEKPNNNLYQNIVQQPSTNYDNINELYRELEIENEIIDNDNETYLIETNTEKEIAHNNAIAIRRFKITNLPFTKLSCVGIKCMMRGCPWNGTYGINLTVLPKILIKAIRSFIIDLNSDRCCCHCWAHFLLFITFLGSNKVAKCISNSSPDIRDLNKMQDLLFNKLETNTNITENMKNTLVKEGNISFVKVKALAANKGLDYLNEGSNYIYNLTVPYIREIFTAVRENSSSEYYNNIVSGMNYAIDMFKCQL